MAVAGSSGARALGERFTGALALGFWSGVREGDFWSGVREVGSSNPWYKTFGHGLAGFGIVVTGSAKIAMFLCVKTSSWSPRTST
jgi:hypothetical protein